MTPRVVLDTNVYISAILNPGKARDALELAREGAFTLVISEPILLEIERLLRLKLGYRSNDIALVLQAIRGLRVFASPAQTLSVIKDDDADNRLLECALEGAAQYIVTGDQRHLLPLQQFEGTRLVSPSAFVRFMAP